MIKLLQELDNNFLEETLLCGNKIVVNSQNRDIYIKIPTYRETMLHYNFNTFSALLNADYEKFANVKKDFNFTFKNRATLLKGLVLWSYFKDTLQYYFKEYVDDIEFDDINAKIKGVEVKPQEFELIADIILVGLGVKAYDFSSSEEEVKDKKEAKPQKNKRIEQLLNKEKEIQEKLKAAKRKKAENSGERITIERYIMAVMYFFGMSKKELFDCNPYTLFWYFKYVDLVDIHQVNQTAAGNGLLSDKKGKVKFKSLTHN